MLKRLIKIAALYEPYAEQAISITQQLQWLIEIQRIFEAVPQTLGDNQRPSTVVASALDKYLLSLTQNEVLNDNNRAIINHINTTFRNRWWGLFVCYDVPDLPATNNALESFFGRMKTNQRRITGTKNVNKFILRYGAFAAFVDRNETKESLLQRLKTVLRNDYWRERKKLDAILCERRDYFRFCHKFEHVLHDIEDSWANLAFADDSSSNIDS